MTDEHVARPNSARRIAGVVLIAAGVATLGLLFFVVAVALNYRASFTGSLPPLLDFAEGIAMLLPVVLLALVPIFFGRRLLRKG